MAKATIGNTQRNDWIAERQSKEFKTCQATEAYLTTTGYWSEPVLITDTDEADKFQNRHPILDTAQDGRLHYRK